MNMSGTEGRARSARGLRSALLAVTLSGLGLLAACASTGSSAYSLSQVDVEPELRGCGTYSDPPRQRGYSVELRFVVDEEGEVQHGTITALPRSSNVGQTHSEEMTRRAIEDAAECSFTPALIDGEPVPVRMTKRFYYPDQG